MKKVYVAHPYGGKEENKQAVENIIRQFVKQHPDIFFVSPIHSIGFLYHDVDYEHGMKYCFELLRMCDELWLCPGWQKSLGCNMEKKFAEEHGIPVKEVRL